MGNLPERLWIKFFFAYTLATANDLYFGRRKFDYWRAEVQKPKGGSVSRRVKRFGITLINVFYRDFGVNPHFV